MTDTPPTAEEIELTRRAARQLNAYFSESMKTLLSEIGAIGRWLIASLLAVNGAGTLAVFNAADRLASPTLDAAPFLAGTLAALASGVLMQRATIAGANMAAEAIGAAVVVEHTGIYNADAKRIADTLPTRTKRNGIWPQLAGWVSAILFAAGAIVTGLTGPKIDPVTQRHCSVLEREMLVSSAARTSDAAAFQAFACKPDPALRLPASRR